MKMQGEIKINAIFHIKAELILLLYQLKCIIYNLACEIVLFGIFMGTENINAV